MMLVWLRLIGLRVQRWRAQRYVRRRAHQIDRLMVKLDAQRPDLDAVIAQCDAMLARYRIDP